MSWTRVARVCDLQAPGPYAATVEGIDLVVIRTGSGLRAFEGRCPHQGALLGEGQFESGVLICRNHRWRFDVDSGRRMGGPQCLRVCPVQEKDGELCANLSALRDGQQPALRGTRRIEDLPGPRGVPLLGNTLQLSDDRRHLKLERWAAVFGPVYAIRVGRTPCVVVSDAALMSEMLRARPQSWKRIGTLAPIFAELGGAGVFSSEGDAWRSQRKLAVEALSYRHIHSFYSTLTTIAERLRHRWERAASAGTTVDVVEDLKRFTVDVTTLLTLGHDVNSIEKDDDVIQRRLEVVFPTVNRRLNSLIPYWRWFRLPADRRADRAVTEVRAWLGELIAGARNRLARHPLRADRPANFLEAMVLARDDAGEPFSDATILGNAMTMLIAGEDTTAITLAWAIHHLCDSPDTVDALRHEVDRQLGADRIPRDVDAVNRLSWVGAVANETMRLRPVGVLQALEANHDTTLGDVALPKGTPILLLPRSPAIDEKNFTAARQFRPGRWLSEEPGRAHDVSAYMPFGNGPRICPGRALALLEMKMVLAMLYRSFEVTRVGESSAVTERLSFVLEPAELRVRLSLRCGAERSSEQSPRKPDYG